ncbi:magnesium transporter [Gleimia hominis]|uniref:magnesium transporter n=1 Tax=Gleimia hominis TaxID=595468 RepID=UPI000C806D21|nr:magnesium transporter [Gleimia hominis]WIK64065.1 magnesium transporter [Gleimia hominis]
MEETVEQIEDLLSQSITAKNAKQVSALITSLSIPELTALVERIPKAKAAVVLRLLDLDRASRLFETLDPAHQADLITALRTEEVLEFFDELDPDDRVSLLDELPQSVARKLFSNLTKQERESTSKLLGFPKDVIGRHMSPEIVDIHDDMTVGDALAIVRHVANDMETIYTLPVVDRQRKLVGVTSLRELFMAESSTIISELMTEAVRAHVNDDAETTARWFLPLDLLAMPIVDSQERYVGLLMWDDAADIVEVEDTEDSARSGASEPLGQPYLATPVLRIVRSRIVWLLVLALSAILTVHVLDTFESTLDKVVTLALFIPLLTGTGGNTGNQAATTVTRALALGDVEKRDVVRVLGREVRVGFTLGAVLGGIGFILASLVFNYQIGLVIGLTLLSICTMAASVGGVMPIIARVVGADPAVFSNPFISTFCDATGLILYFLIAKTVLGI